MMCVCMCCGGVRVCVCCVCMLVPLSHWQSFGSKMKQMVCMCAHVRACVLWVGECVHACGCVLWQSTLLDPLFHWLTSGSKIK